MQQNGKGNRRLIQAATAAGNHALGSLIRVQVPRGYTARVPKLHIPRPPMNRRPGLITLAILILVIVIAAWSKLRYLREGYDEPQRWKINEHPALLGNQSQTRDR